MNIRQKLVALLKARVTTAVWRGQVPSRLDAYPCVVYHVLAGNTTKTLLGPTTTAYYIVRLDCLALDAADASALADAVNALEGPISVQYGLRWALQQDEADGEYPPQEQQEKGIERVSITLKLWV